MPRQLEVNDRHDRIIEELRFLSPIMGMYDRWIKEDVQDWQDAQDAQSVQDAQDNPTGPPLPLHAYRWEMLDTLTTRFAGVKAALKARQDARVAQLIEDAQDAQDMRVEEWM